MLAIWHTLRCFNVLNLIIINLYIYILKKTPWGWFVNINTFWLIYYAFVGQICENLRNAQYMLYQVCTVASNIFWILCMELALLHPLDIWYFEMASRFVDNLCTPAVSIFTLSFLKLTVNWQTVKISSFSGKDFSFCNHFVLINHIQLEFQCVKLYQK